jgi:hypothetical protein
MQIIALRKIRQPVCPCRQQSRCQDILSVPPHDRRKLSGLCPERSRTAPYVVVDAQSQSPDRIRDVKTQTLNRCILRQDGLLCNDQVPVVIVIVLRNNGFANENTF